MNKEDLNGVYKILRNTLDIVRGSIKSSDYDIILYLLITYRDKILTGDIFKDSKSFLKAFAVNQDNRREGNLDYQISYSWYNEKIITRLGSEKTWAIYEHFKNLDNYLDDFSTVFEIFLKNILDEHIWGEHYQPLELTRLVLNLASPKKGSKVFNPFAGTCSYGAYLDKEMHYYGQEIDEKTWALGLLRLKAHGKSDKFILKHEDSIKKWPKEEDKFDLIVSTPPFGYKVRPMGFDIPGIENHIIDVEQFLVERTIGIYREDQLSNNGTGIFIFRHNFIFSNYYKEDRKYLVDNDLIDTIISFPGGIFYHTALPFVIFVINKSKKNPGYVKLVDASRFIRKEDKRRRVIDDLELHKAINLEIPDKDFIRVVSNEQLETYKYNLNVPRYFIPKIENGIKLKNFLTLLLGEKVHENEIHKIVGIRDLIGTIGDPILKLENLKESEIKHLPYKKIDRSCLLISLVGDELNPTYFEYKGDPIFTDRSIASFLVDTKKIDPLFLFLELKASYVIDQLKGYRYQEVGPKRLIVEDFLNIQLILPTLLEQKAKVQGFKEVTQKIKTLEKEKQAIIKGQERIIYEQSASLKHALGKPMLNINSAIRLLEKTLSKKMPNWQGFKLSDVSSITLLDTIEAIKFNLDQIHNLLDRNTSEFDVNNYKLEPLDIVNFLKKYVKSLKVSLPKNVTVALREDNDIKEYFNSKVIINGNKQLLETLFDNIVENAQRHGFVDDSKHYNLSIDLELFWMDSETDSSEIEFSPALTDIRINITNDGVPFPENFGIEKYIKRAFHAGQTGNTGEGGYQVNEIIKYLNHGESTLHIDTLLGDLPHVTLTSLFFGFPILNIPKQ